ncbi:hypothetical protein K9M79_08235 [Candidatus Woesearchaeota archaeon]|nr:hypothetical protein [Candidatus Woesearchaeota archaeon]
MLNSIQMLKKGLMPDDEVVQIEINFEYHLSSIKQKIDRMSQQSKNINALAKKGSTEELKDELQEFEMLGTSIVKILSKMAELNLNEEALNMALKRRMNYFLMEMLKTIKHPES